MSMAATFFTALAGGVAANAALMKPEEVRPGVWRTMGGLCAVAAGLGLALTFLIVWGFKVWEKRWHAYMRPREQTKEKKPQAATAA